MDRFRKYIPLAIEQMSNDDLLICSGVAGLTALSFGYSSHSLFNEFYLHNVPMVDAILALYHRIAPTKQSEEWFVQRCEQLDYEMCCLGCVSM